MTAVAQDVPEAADQALDFIDKLDNIRYLGFKTHLENYQLMNIGKFPETLVNAYGLASKYRTSALVSPLPTQTLAHHKCLCDCGEWAQEFKEGGKEKIVEDGDIEKPANVFPCCICGDKAHRPWKCPQLEECKQCIKKPEEAKGQKEDVVALSQFWDDDPDSVVL